MKQVLLFILMYLAVVVEINAQGSDCPRIYRSGDTLKTDPAGGYQWILNGTPIQGATKQWHLGTVKGDYSVEVSGASPVFTIKNPGKSIYGRVIDERYEPIADAKITVADKTVSSDNQGVFSLKDLDIKGTTTVLTIEKTGFWNNTQRITFFDSKETNLTAMLEPLRVTNRFDAQKGATVSERGFLLTFPPNAAVTTDGKTYTGTINLSLKRAFPAEEGFGYRMPGGDFSAIDQNGQEKMLVSYGFMSAEMQGAKGEKLNLAKDKEATLEFYIPWEQNKTAPDSMPLWHFDEATAVWKPEGTARKVGPRYMGTVKHFSSWNCDYPTGRATVKGKVVDCKNQPLPIRIPVQVGQRYVTLDNEGYYTSFAPSETTFEVTASVDTATVTPLTEGEERTVKDLGANIVGGAVGCIDSSGTLAVYGYGVKEYSVDSGKTFQPKSQKLNFTEKFPKKGIVRDSSDCEANFRIYLIQKRGDCQMLDSVSLKQKTTFSNISSALFSKEAVYKLDLWNVKINGSGEMLSVFPCLQRLYLRRNELNSVPESIGLLNNLQILNLSTNQLTNLPEIITQLNYLEELYLHENTFKNIPETIGQLSNLKTLEMYDNQLTSLPEVIGNLDNLQMLKLSNNKITNLPETIGQLKNLRHLDLDNNQLTNLPETIAQLSNLQYLYLEFSNLTNIPETIVQLSNLRAVNLAYNEITNIPEAFGQLTKLSWLNLRQNQLTSLPETIGQLSNLQTLDLTNNQLTSLPETIGQLSNLKYLDLYGNNLTSLPETIGQLNKLLRLELSYNQLTSLPETIGQLSNLEKLTLQQNNLTSVPETIGQLNKLRSLNLSLNQLTSLPESISNLKDTLQSLWLGDNNFSEEEKAKIRAWLPNTSIIW